jgi:DNA-binding transcriptional MerR regulator
MAWLSSDAGGKCLVNTYSTKQAAEAVGVPVSTLKHWVSTLSIPVTRDSSGNYRFTDETIESLKQVHRWRDSGRPLSELELTDGQAVAKTSTNDDQQAPNDSQATDRPSFNGEELVELIESAITRTIMAESGLAGRFAQVAHQAGALEATLRERERELSELRERVAILPAPGRVEELERMLREKDAELERLRRRPWFAFWR